MLKLTAKDGMRQENNLGMVKRINNENKNPF